MSYECIIVSKKKQGFPLKLPDFEVTTLKRGPTNEVFRIPSKTNSNCFRMSEMTRMSRVRVYITLNRWEYVCFRDCGSYTRG